jgi:hypothetical protein
LRTGYLLKCLNFDEYNNLCLTKEQVEEIATKNEKEGISKNKFKYGIYFN